MSWHVHNIPFVDSSQGIFKWADFEDPIPPHIRWNNQDWDIYYGEGSTYYIPTKQLTLPFAGALDEVVPLQDPNGDLEE